MHRHIFSVRKCGAKNSKFHLSQVDRKKLLFGLNVLIFSSCSLFSGRVLFIDF